MEYKPGFIFLSEILGIAVVDSNSKKRIGKVNDVSAHFKEAYPKIVGIIIKMKNNSRCYLSWQNVREINQKKKRILVENTEELSACPDELPGGEVLLKKSFFDRQIINVSGLKVVRVNDLHLLKEKSNLWLVHFDVGFKGLLRRLGLAKPINAVFAALFSRPIKNVFIRWKDSQPITEVTPYGKNDLKIPYNKLSEVHPADLADILADLGIEDRIMVFNSLDYITAARVLQEVAMNIRIQIAEALEPAQFVEIIEAMDMDEVADLIEKLQKEKVAELFASLSEEKVKEIKELLAYSWRSAGSIMNTDFVAIRKYRTVKQALNRIKKDYTRTELIYYINVIDNKQRLVGVLTLRDLLLAKTTTPIAEIMQENIVKVDTDTHIKEVAQIFFKYNFYSLPVVDEKNRIAGIISMKDAFEAVFPEIRKAVEG
jgi:magnesium transporter